MAEFSKQWTELNDPELPWDFDIEEIASTLEKEHYTPIICEGLGFVAIGKDESGKIMLAYRNWTTDEIYWKTLEYVIKTEENGI